MHTFSCRFCYKEVTRKRLGSQFCSQACGSKYNVENGLCDGWIAAGRANNQKTGKWEKCLVCGNLIYRKPSHIKKGISFLCSKKCHGEWTTIKYSGKNSAKYGSGMTREEKKIAKRKARRKYYNRKRQDITFRLRQSVSTAVSRALRMANSSKKGCSCLRYLPFTIQQLKEHLELRFESWMSWNNYGDGPDSYRTWQIDHIVPQIRFSYESMDCPEFRKCWSLENLRPLSRHDNSSKGAK